VVLGDHHADHPVSATFSVQARIVVMPGMLMSRRRAVGNYLVFALGLFTLATTVFAVWRHFSPLPIGDSWDGTIGFYMRAMQAPWQAFFEQHNEHRLAFSRLIFFADVRYFGGRNVLSLIANLVLAGVLATILYRIAIHYRATLSREARFGLAGGVLVFAFSWIQNENFTWGFQSQWFAVYLFALLAFHSIERTAEAEAGNERVKARRWFVTGVASAWAAAYSMSSGVLVFPVLIIQAIYLRLKPRDLLVIVAVTVAVWFAYFIDWHKPASSGNLTSGLREHPVAGLEFVLLYLGSPAFHARLGLKGAYACGIFALMALVVSCIITLRPNKQRPQAIALLAFAVFVSGNALLTASGRLWFGVESALASRYTTASLTGWLALIIFAALNSNSSKQRERVVVIAALATLLVASDQRFAFRADHEETYERLVAGVALRSHVYDAEITKAIYPFPAPLIAIAKNAEAARLSIFAPDQPDYLVPPTHISATAACDGTIDNISATRTPGIYRASGWIYDAADRQMARAIVISDASGTTLGTGVTGGERDDLRKLYGRRAGFIGWTAFFNPPKTGGIRINGQIAADTYCALQVEGEMPATPGPSPQ
jgi:Ca2+/Na+ antiporter